MAVMQYHAFCGLTIGPSSPSSPGSFRGYSQDGSGSVVATHQADGTVDGTFRYKPWGETLSASGPIPRFGWFGGLGFKQSGAQWPNFYGRRRHYSSSDGTFDTGNSLNLPGVRQFDVAAMWRMLLKGMKMNNIAAQYVPGSTNPWTPYQPSPPFWPTMYTPPPPRPIGNAGGRLPQGGQIFKNRDLEVFGLIGAQFADCMACCSLKRLLGSWASIASPVGSFLASKLGDKDGNCSTQYFKIPKLPDVPELPGLKPEKPSWMPSDVWDAIWEQLEADWERDGTKPTITLPGIPGGIPPVVKQALDDYEKKKKLWGKCADLTCEANCLFDLRVKTKLGSVDVDPWQYCGLMPDVDSCQKCCDEAFDDWPFPGVKKDRCFYLCGG